MEFWIDGFLDQWSFAVLHYSITPTIHNSINPAFRF